MTDGQQSYTVIGNRSDNQDMEIDEKQINVTGDFGQFNSNNIVQDHSNLKMHHTAQNFNSNQVSMSA